MSKSRISENEICSKTFTVNRSIEIKAKEGLFYPTLILLVVVLL